MTWSFKLKPLFKTTFSSILCSCTILLCIYLAKQASVDIWDPKFPEVRQLADHHVWELLHKPHLLRTLIMPRWKNTTRYKVTVQSVLKIISASLTTLCYYSFWNESFMATSFVICIHKICCKEAQIKMHRCSSVLTVIFRRLEAASSLHRSW